MVIPIDEERNTQDWPSQPAIVNEQLATCVIKENQAGLLEEVELLFKDAEDKNFCGIDADDFETSEKGHGRVEIRKYISKDASELPSTREWVG